MVVAFLRDFFLVSFGDELHGTQDTPNIPRISIGVSETHPSDSAPRRVCILHVNSEKSARAYCGEERQGMERHGLRSGRNGEERGRALLRTLDILLKYM